MNKTKRKETIKELAQLFREDLAFQTILIDKYHIMVTFYLGRDNKDAHEEKIANLKVTHPELTCIPLEQRNTLPPAVWKDEELDGFAEHNDRVEQVVKRCLVDQMYADLVARANILTLLYEKVTVMASIKNTETIRLLLSLEKDIYFLDSFSDVTAGNKINAIAANPQEDTASWSKTKRDVYDMLEFLIRGMTAFHCRDLNELVATVKRLECSDKIPADLAKVVKASSQNLDMMMKSSTFERIKHQERYFLDITTLASMGLGDKINYMLDQEEKLYELPVSDLDTFMDGMERSVGLL